MNDDKRSEQRYEESSERPGRRDFLQKTGIAVGAAVVGGTILSGCGQQGGEQGAPVPGSQPSGQKPPAGGHDGGDSHAKACIAPGKLDDYYGFWSGGQSGEIRILGLPSMRVIKRVPVFNRESGTGWGLDDYSKGLLKGRHAGDTHHVHLSYTDGTYDGRYVYVNDKFNARLARVRIATMEVDAIAELPNSQGTHGIFPQRHKTGYVFCNSEFRTPQPNDGRDMGDPKKYGALHTAVDGETMEVKWQVLVEGNMDLCATDYEGKYSFATCYNSEGGVVLEEMMASERDYLYVFNIAAIEQAVSQGKTIRLGDSSVPVVDARSENPDENSEYVLRIPVPKSPHGVNIDPSGKYAVVSGKLSPTVSVVEIAKIDDAFKGKISPRDCVVAEPEVGLGPLHTAFDGRGNAYTSIFLDSQVTKWNIQKAIEAYAKNDTKASGAIVQKIDVHYQIGHINASMSETKEADGKWLIALCKFSKDRFLPVGPLHHENDQLIDISGDQMVLVHDGPTFPEPHDAVIVRKDIIDPVKVDDRKHPRYKLYEEWAKEDGVDLMKDNKVVRRPDGSVRIYMTSQAPKFGMTEFRVKSGQKVQVILTNQDNVEDLSHGFAVSLHDVCILVNAQGTNSVTFTAGKPGVYWYYCPWFCHALHLEMRGRMLVEP